MTCKRFYAILPLIVMYVSQSMGINGPQPNCTFDIKFGYDYDGNHLENVSCSNTCTTFPLTHEQISNHQSFYYHENENKRKYNKMVKVTVREDGTLKCVFLAANSSKKTKRELPDSIAERLRQPNAEERSGYLIPTDSNGRCSTLYVYAEEIKTCLRFSDDKLSWHNATLSCNADGGNLVIVDSEKKQNAFNSAAGSTLVPRLTTPISTYGLYMWIGLSDNKSEGKFEWMDGSPVNYSRWFAAEPNNAGGKENCVVIAFLNNISLWDDRPCDAAERYVCEMKPKVTIKTRSTIPSFETSPTLSATISPFAASSGVMVIQICPNGWWKSNASDTCYYIGEDGRTFEESVYYCNDKGGSLASIPDILEMQFIQGLLSKNDIIIIWIGLTSNEGESPNWIDGTHFNYTSWADHQPDDWKNSEDCVAIDKTWKYLWIDISCQIKVKQLCKRRAEKLAIKHCPSGSSVISRVDENFDLEDLICPTLYSNYSLVCLEGAGPINSNQYLVPLTVVSSLLGLHFLSLALVIFYFYKFHKKHTRHDVNVTKEMKKHSGEDLRMEQYAPPKIMKVPAVPRPFGARERESDETNGNFDVYDGPEYDTDKYGYYVNPKRKMAK